MINPNKGKIVSVADQQDLRKLLRKFEKQKEAKPQTPKDLEYAVRLIEHYQNLQETGGHLVKLFQPGPLGIDKYVPHKAFFDATANYQQVLFRASNQTGKTQGGAFACSCWATGDYPDWWEGRVFDKAPVIWACGDTNDTVREILQSKFLGTPEGTGLIAANKIYDVVKRPNTGGTVDSIWVRNSNGKLSQIKFKCHPYDSRILMADGNWANIGDVKIGDFIRSPDGSSRQVTQRFVYEDAPVLKLSTPTGNIRCTPNHPIYTHNRGWITAEEVEVGDELEWCYYEHPASDRPDWLIALTAVMIGDGCTRNSSPRFTCAEPEIVEILSEVLPEHLKIVPIGGTIDYRISTTDKRQGNALKNSLERDGLWDCLSIDKHIPEWVFRLSYEKRILFLRWLWTCDGTVSPKYAAYCSASKRIAEDVRLLLWSVGIRTKLTPTYNVKYPGKTYYQLILNGANRLAFTPIGKINRNNEPNLKPRERNNRTVVQSVEYVGTDTVYCVGVEDIHELIVEGYRVGNTYQSGPESFYGKPVDVVWFDEEPDGKDAPLIWNQAYIRLTTTNGTFIITFTPLLGWTALLKDFTEKAVDATPRKQDG